jgi:hypothetical protein
MLPACTGRNCSGTIPGIAISFAILSSIRILKCEGLYDFKLDLTRSIKIDFNANNYSVVDEPEGKIDTKEDRDSIQSNIWGKNFLARKK